jgi:hypothetical protein
MLTIEQAAEIARKAHGERRDKLGYQEIDHIERVAATVSAKARPVAYLHDAVEDGLYSFRRAYTLMSPTQFQALLLVTREPGNGLTYMEYIRAIRDFPGEAGDIAREIKNADLDDNMSRPGPESMRGMKEPGGRYYRAKALLCS